MEEETKRRSQDVEFGVHTLTRTVRLSVLARGVEAGPSNKNGYAGWPTMRGIGVYCELDIVVAGEPDGVTGYLMDIKAIDEAVRASALPVVRRAVHEQQEPAGVIAEVARELRAGIGAGFKSVVWRLTPCYALEVSMADTRVALLRQRFDFAASHRLHVPALSDEENRRLFGKCNYPSGHGHNYQFEASVRVPTGGQGFALPELEEVADRVILSRFDHRHLNEDAAEFDQRRGGVNPSVENIARVFFDLLAPAIKAKGAELASVTVWETDRTCATYPA